MKYQLLAVNGKLVSVEGGGGMIHNGVDARTAPDAPDKTWETIEEIDNGDGTISLKSSAGFYASAQPDGTLEWNRTESALWEKFRKVTAGGTAVGFQAAWNGRWICADLGLPVSMGGPQPWTGVRVVCDRMAMGPYETFSQMGASVGVPTREEVCTVRVPFQGFYATTPTYGQFPMFGPETSSLPHDDLDQYLDQILAAGYTHAEFAVAWNYQERDYQFPVPGVDLSGNLGELAFRMQMAIDKGLRVALFCAGDGEGVDPQGFTKGRPWLMENFAGIVEATRDQLPYTLYLPGYDGVWYGWNGPDAVRQWWLHARDVLGPSGYQGIEWAAGIMHLGDGSRTYTDPAGQACDAFLQEFPIGPFPGRNPDQVYQVSARLLGSDVYRRPASQDPHDDPPPVPRYPADTPRGPQYVVAYEFDTYPWVRGEISAEQVQADRQAFEGCGWPVVC